MRLVSWKGRLQSLSEMFFTTDLTHVMAESFCEDCESIEKPAAISQVVRSEEPAVADQAARVHDEEMAREGVRKAKLFSAAARAARPHA